jgi:hypothetical protein
MAGKINLLWDEDTNTSSSAMVHSPWSDYHSLFRKDGGGRNQMKSKKRRSRKSRSKKRTKKRTKKRSKNKS